MARSLLFLLIFCGSSLGQPSLSLDETFGDGGKVIRSVGVNASARKVLVQPDGKILVLGLASTPQNSVRMLRFDPDGSVDTSFGNNGQVDTSLGGNALEAWHAGILLTNGQIVVGGNTGPAGSEDFALARFNGDGSLDTDFGLNGFATLDFGNSAESVNALAVHLDGKIVAVGKSNDLHLEQDFAAARFNSDGSLDTTFSDNGKFILFRNSADIAYAVIIQRDGRVLIGGRVGPFCGVLRLDSEGGVDPSFGVNGMAVQNSTSIGKDLALQQDGKIISVGEGLVRFSSDGTLDTTFGMGGKVTLFATFLSAVSVRPDGSILAVGNSSTFLPATDENFSTALFNADGSFITRTDTDFNGHERAEAVWLEPDGSVITAGLVARAATTSDFGLARYVGLTRLTNTTADLDGDGRTDLSVYRDGTWFSVNSSNNVFNAVQFGLGTDLITPADFDGDARTDHTVFRDGVWYQLSSSDLVVRHTFFGLSSDVPIPADYDGDGKDDIAVFRTGTWYVLGSSTGFTATQFGTTGDIPIRGDFDGDGRFDLAVYRGGTWYELTSSGGFVAVQFGLADDRPVAADYDGDRRTDITVYRDGVWYLLQSERGFEQFQFGLATDIPVPGDYDGDGRSDIAVYRNGTWYLSQSSSGFGAFQFGTAGDVPVPSR